MTRTHLFVVPGRAAFGEPLLALRIARELHAAGDRVVFLAPAAHRILLAGTPFAHGVIDPVQYLLDRALPDVIRRQHCDTVVLVDLLLVLVALGRTDPSFLDHLPVPTYALDIWDLRRSPLVDDGLVISEAARTLVPARLVPVPFARPETDGAYCALPEIDTIDDRAATRSELGVRTHERLVMMTTAQFQTRGLTPQQKRAVATIPGEVVGACLGCDPRVRVVHVGPRALVEHERYLHQPQVAPQRFEQIMRASDLLVTANQAATGISTALALGVPPIAVIGETTEYRFRVFPLGFYGFMEPMLRDNPYTSVVPAIDVRGLRDSLHPWIFDDAVRSLQRQRMQDYVETVRRLPRASHVLRPDAPGKPPW